MKPRRKGAASPDYYEEWMSGEGIPIHEAAAGIDDVTELPRKPWARTGGAGAFIQLLGPQQAERGIYVGEIPGGKALEAERHLYQEAIIILKGLGSTEVWQEGMPKRIFEWGEGSVFAPPLNCWHRMINGSREPTLFLAVTTAPKAMNLFCGDDVVFHCAHRFLNHFSDETDYFVPTQKREKMGRYSTLWYTNFIADAKDVLLDSQEQKVSGGQITGYRMANGFPNGHISAWPAGRYHKAHYHGPGAILVGLEGEGYVLVWPHTLGTHPYQKGESNKVLKINWGPRSIYSPPDGWFHQHFNGGSRPARHLAVYGASSGVPGYTDSVGQDFSGTVSFREGGTLIDYEDEDPQIRKDFAATLKEKGISLQMPAVTYRD
jgi:oxalate decarboxylase/phosphoglucose isomerase-like protein (cupin superfamily)